MIVNGVDLDGLADETSGLVIPDPVPGRVAHLDADFLAYQVTAVRDGSEVSFDDMKHNVQVAIDKLVSLSGATSYHLHLTPSGSDKGGRSKVALQKEYQGNRNDKPKPQYLNLMRQHLATAYPGTLHQFCEADDGMSSSQYQAMGRGERNLSIIVSKDKDLSMVPGLHLDWDTGEIVDAEEFGTIWLQEKETKTGKSTKLKGFGQKFFWAQMLMGDTADNIKGLPLVPARVVEQVKFLETGKAVKLLDKPCGPALTSKLLNQVTSNRQAFASVMALYRACPEEYHDYRDGSVVSWQQVFMSEAMLLWMRRDKHDHLDVARWFKEIL